MAPRPPTPRSARAESNPALLAQGPAYALHALIDFVREDHRSRRQILLLHLAQDRQALRCRGADAEHQNRWPVPAHGLQCFCTVGMASEDKEILLARKQAREAVKGRSVGGRRGQV
jgi:hypothetical protein